MNKRANRLKGLLIVIISLFLAITVCGVFYYFKIKQNENYQNQLHFRELSDVGRSIDNGLDQLENAANIKNSEIRRNIIVKNVNQNSIALVSSIVEQLEKIERLEDTIRQMSSAKFLLVQQLDQLSSDKTNTQKLRGEVQQQQELISATDEKLMSASDALLDHELEFFLLIQQILNPLTSENNEISSVVKDDCLEDSITCEWLERFISQAIDLVDENSDSASKSDAETKAQAIVNPILENFKRSYEEQITTLEHEITANYPKPQEYDYLINEVLEIKALGENSSQVSANLTKYIFTNNLLKNTFSDELEELERAVNDYTGVSVNYADKEQAKQGVLRKVEKILQQLEQGKRVAIKQEELNQKQTLFKLIFSEFSQAEAGLEVAFKNILIARSDVNAYTVQLNNQKNTLKQKEDSLKDLKIKQESLSVNSPERNILAEQKSILELNELTKRKEKESLENELAQNVRQAIDELYTDFRTLYPDKNLDLPNNVNIAKQRAFRSKSAADDKRFKLLVNFESCLQSWLKNHAVSQCEAILIKNSNNDKNDELPITPASALKNIKTVNKGDVGFEQSSEHIAFDLTKKTAIKGLGNSGALSVPIVDLLGGASRRYPLVLFVDSEGNTLSRKENSKLNAALVGIRFDNSNQLLAKVLAKTASKENSNEQVAVENHNNVSLSKLETGDDEESLGYSEFVDMELAGVEYRLFVTPYSSQHISADSKELRSQFYLIGFREKSQLTSAKLSVSHSLVLMAIFSIIGLVAMIPLLKIRLISNRQAFSFFDRHFAVIGLLMLVVVLVIAGFDYRYYQMQKEETASTSRAIFVQMRNRFNHELHALSNYANKYIDVSKQVNSKDNLFDKKLADDYFLDNLFFLEGGNNYKQSSSLHGVAYWSSEKLFRKSESISLNIREYANRAINNDVWPVDLQLENDKCSPGIFMERIFNLRGSRLTTQFSRTCPRIDKMGQIKNVTSAEQLNASGIYLSALSFGTKLQTFFQPIFPANFGYMVFENDTGQVVYHSDDLNRSLVENVFVETDNDGTLKALVNQPYLYNQPVNFNTTYSGEAYNFSVGHLTKGLPWTLVVFYKKQEIRALNFIASLVSITLALLGIFVGYIAFSVVTAKLKHKRRWWFWAPSVRGEVLLNRSVSITFIGLIFVAIITYVLCNVVFEHHTVRYTQANNAELASKIKRAREEHRAYREQLIDSEVATSFTRYSAADVPCYLGNKKGTSANILQTCAVTTNEQPLDVQYSDDSNQYFLSFVESFWRFSQLKNEIDNVLVVTEKLNKITAKKPELAKGNDNNLNLYFFNEPSSKALTEYPALKANDGSKVYSQSFFKSLLELAMLLVGLLVVVAIFYVVVFHWLFKSLVGINIAKSFRLADSLQAPINKLALAGFFKNNQYVQVVRPQQELLDALLAKHPLEDNEFEEESDKKKTNYLDKPLLKQAVINVAQLESTMPVDWVVSELFGDSATSEINYEGKTVLLSGFEGIASQQQVRLFVLELLEFLMSQRTLSIILLCDISPLYRLTQQSEYPLNDEEEELATAQEVLRWSAVLKHFIKVYDWSSSTKKPLPSHAKIDEIVAYESNGWPELSRIAQLFGQNNQQRAQASGNNNSLKQWNYHQVIEFFNTHAGAFYRYRWELCTKNERLLMYQLANGYEPNPKNIEPLEHLTRRGYIYRHYGWHLVNKSFEHFVKSVEQEETIEDWVEEANEGLWRYLRIPFFALIIALVAIMVYSATDAVESALGILTGVLGLIPLAIRNLSLFKSG